MSKNRKTSSESKASSSKKSRVHTFFYPIDSTNDFYDPFSDTNLFLAQKIKQVLLHEATPKAWSKKIQDLLIRQIIPEFSLHFPRCRIDTSALRKTWQKVHAYLNSTTENQGALTKDGSVDILVMIQENFQHILSKQSSHSLSAYHEARMSAGKIAECIATLDGMRPSIEELTKIIWSIHRHLVLNNHQSFPCPYEKHDPIDKLLVRFQLELVAENACIRQEELFAEVQSKFINIRALCRIRSLEECRVYLWILIAQKEYDSLSIHQTLRKDELLSIEVFVKQQCHTRAFSSSNILQFVNKILFLYKLSAKMDSHAAENQLEAAISYVISLSTDRIEVDTPVLRPEVYSFIQSEVQLIKGRHMDNPLEQVLNSLINTFEAAKGLPVLNDRQFLDLELLIWRYLYEEYKLLDRLSPPTCMVMEEELSSVRIEYPDFSLQEVIQQTMQHLRQMQHLFQQQSFDSEDAQNKIEQKIYLWTVQGDLVYGSIQFDTMTSLFKTLKKTWKRDKQSNTLSHQQFIDAVLQHYLRAFPHLLSHASALKRRITILYKYFWYQELSHERDTTFDRYIQWHYAYLESIDPLSSDEIIMKKIQSICTGSLPLIPFNEQYVENQISRPKRAI